GVAVLDALAPEASADRGVVEAVVEGYNRVQGILAVVQTFGDHDVAVAIERLRADPGNVAAFAGVDLAGGLALEEAAVGVLRAFGQGFEQGFDVAGLLVGEGEAEGAFGGFEGHEEAPGWQ